MSGARAIDIPAVGERPPEERATLELLVYPVHGRPQARLVGPNDETIELPDEIFQVLRIVAGELLSGNGISVIPRDHELTTSEAAEMLNVSRPFLIKQLEAGELPFHKVGSHRRIRLNDLLAYRTKLSQRSKNALERMADQAEELGLYEE